MKSKTYKMKSKTYIASVGGVPLTDHEIEKQLALALGWPQALRSSQGTVVETRNPSDRVKSNGKRLKGWRVFNHKDWNVAGPISERLGSFPRMRNGAWIMQISNTEFVEAVTPQGAIALAAIKLMKP